MNALRTSPRRVARAMALAIHAEHCIRDTFEDILPRLDAGAEAPARLPAPLPAGRLIQIQRRERAATKSQAAPPA